MWGHIPPCGCCLCSAVRRVHLELDSGSPKPGFIDFATSQLEALEAVLRAESTKGGIIEGSRSPPSSTPPRLARTEYPPPRLLAAPSVRAVLWKAFEQGELGFGVLPPIEAGPPPAHPEAYPKSAGPRPPEAFAPPVQVKKEPGNEESPSKTDTVVDATLAAEGSGKRENSDKVEDLPSPAEPTSPKAKDRGSKKDKEESRRDKRSRSKGKKRKRSRSRKSPKGVESTPKSERGKEKKGRPDESDEDTRPALRRGGPRPPSHPPPRHQGTCRTGGSSSSRAQGPGWIGRAPSPGSWRWRTGKNKGIVKRAKQERHFQRKQFGR